MSKWNQSDMLAARLGYALSENSHLLGDDVRAALAKTAVNPKIPDDSFLHEPAATMSGLQANLEKFSMDGSHFE